MILAEHEIQRVIEHVKTAFPNFADWKYNNEENADHFGFSLWGRYALNPEEIMPIRFFVTLDTDDEHCWHGHLTIGQPHYLWTSADVGDAHLLGTKPCKTKEDAITALQAEIENLFEIFLPLPLRGELYVEKKRELN
ncbi:MAG: hypothetical protein GY862_13190 [Gammaproteobacteria bacterium]|nr:hypothetical protein [Gammaproteobacteria bacterium]